MIWGRYFTLVDGTVRDFVPGWTYLVEIREHEDRPRWYETNNYEVVRCEIWGRGSKVPGLTFKFCSKKKELT
jgi:hypothetical protein